MESESEIKPDMLADIRGGTFRVIGKSYQEGFWDLEKTHGRRIVLSFPEAEVQSGIEEHNAGSVIGECSRQESPAKDAARLKFLPRNAS